MTTPDYELAHQLDTLQLLSGLIDNNGRAQMLIAAYPTLTAIVQAPFPGLVKLIGPASARKVRCALALAGHLSRETLGDRPILDTPEKVADFLRDDARPYTVETFVVLVLDTRRRLIRGVRMAQGTLDSLLVHSREVFRHAIAVNGAAVILSHNHPSGDPTPSEADIRVTRDLVRAGQLLKIEVLDHVILGQRTNERPKDFLSLKELGYFYA